MKRDLIEEIIDRRSRSNPTTDRDTAFTNRMSTLMSAYHNIQTLPNEAQAELNRYAPVALVAMTESYFKQALADIIDLKEQNGEKPPEIKELKMSISLAHALKGRKLTFGEVITHSLSYSNFSSICNSFKAVTGSPFVDEIKPALLGLNFAGHASESDPMGFVIRLTEKTYRARHIICHEHAPDFSISVKEVYEMVLGIQSLQCATGLCLMNNWAGYRKMQEEE